MKILTDRELHSRIINNTHVYMSMPACLWNLDNIDDKGYIENIISKYLENYENIDMAACYLMVSSTNRGEIHRRLGIVIPIEFLPLIQLSSTYFKYSQLNTAKHEDYNEWHDYIFGEVE